jgi:predicted adenylyl cyclase CyaB
MRNLELKVACDADRFAAVQRSARALGPSSVIRQRDTYFAVPTGRLKLREIEENGARTAELIGYSRPDVAGARWSQYYRAEFRPEQIAPLVAMMERTIGVRVVVEKLREVVIYRRTRIHLDRVERLGHFVELETVTGDDVTEAEAERELTAVAERLGIAGLPAIGGSYSDLLESSAAKARPGMHAEVSE